MPPIVPKSTETQNQPELFAKPLRAGLKWFGQDSPADTSCFVSKSEQIVSSVRRASKWVSRTVPHESEEFS